ncbi:zinc-ribbon domain-containing protein [Roseomonas elaeocarpi]|uniref:Zinc-ribbon domain-containing protein n=1 Tax=Roseomonas elaeocarpi TaxID=907779 RepID=A0ABV6JYE7_9PROT
MRIICPRCEAAYEVPEMMLSSGLSAGRTVRCARCGARWAPLPPPAGARPEETEAPVPLVPDPVVPGQGTPAQETGPGTPDLAAPDLTAPDLAVPEAGTAVADPGTPAAPDGAAGEEVRLLPPVAGPRRDRLEPRRTRPALLLGWIASLGVVAGLVAVLLLRHEAVAAAWPPALWLYRFLGLA